MQLNQKQLAELQQESAQLVKNVGQYTVDLWHKTHTLSYKDARDTASEVDVEAERQLREGLHKLLPEAGFIVEEGLTEEHSEFNWTIDPIDGTKFYVNNVPMFYNQVALTYYNEPILGHAYNPVSQQLFSASLGNGTSLNGKRLKLNTRSDLNSSIVDINFGGRNDMDWKLTKLAALAKSVYRIRITSNFLSKYILTGGIDCSIALSELPKPVDILPDIIMMKEIGLQTEYVTIDNRSILLVANKELFAKTLPLIQSSTVTP